MTPELKTKWLAALRSGEYAQTAARLREPDGTALCCLGVLCEVSGAGRWNPNFPSRYDLTDAITLAGDLSIWDSKSSYAVPAFGVPKTVADEAMMMNDMHHKSFAEIADYLEANL